MRVATWVLPLVLIACGSKESIVSHGASGSGGSSAGGGGSSSSTAGSATVVAGTPSAPGGASNSGGSPGATGGVPAATGGVANPTGGASVVVSGGTAGAASMGGGSGAAAGALSGTGGQSSTGSGGSASGSLLDRLSTAEVTIPAGVKAGVRNYRVWGQVMFKVAPLYIAPLANCGSLVCLTTGGPAAPNARLVRLDANDRLKDVLDLGAGLECRGVAAEPDGHFAALLWSNTDDAISVKRYDASGAEVSSTALSNADNNPTEFGIGESRLEFGAGKYGAYYHVHSDSGHEGDTLKYVDAASGKESTGWSWGCSHSMSNLLTFNPSSSGFLPTCVTDCYPGTTGSDFASASIGGVYLNNRTKVMDVAGGCNGNVAAELGGAAAAPSGWKLVFNAHQDPASKGQSSYGKSMNQDVGFTSVGSNSMPSGVVWLTTSPALNEADVSIARWEPADDAAEQYVVGWSEGAVYKLGRLDPSGAFLEGPSDVSAKAHWGQRDDPFRQHYNKDVVWAWFDAAGSTTLKIARLRSGGSFACAAF